MAEELEFSRVIVQVLHAFISKARNHHTRVSEKEWHRRVPGLSLLVNLNGEEMLPFDLYTIDCDVLALLEVHRVACVEYGGNC